MFRATVRGRHRAPRRGVSGAGLWSRLTYRRRVRARLVRLVAFDSVPRGAAGTTPPGTDPGRHYPARAEGHVTPVPGALVAAAPARVRVF